MLTRISHTIAQFIHKGTRCEYHDMELDRPEVQILLRKICKYIVDRSYTTYSNIYLQ